MSIIFRKFKICAHVAGLHVVARADIVVTIGFQWRPMWARADICTFGRVDMAFTVAAREHLLLLG